MSDRFTCAIALWELFDTLDFDQSGFVDVRNLGQLLLETTLPDHISRAIKRKLEARREDNKITFDDFNKEFGPLLDDESTTHQNLTPKTSEPKSGQKLRRSTYRGDVGDAEDENTELRTQVMTLEAEILHLRGGMKVLEQSKRECTVEAEEQLRAYEQELQTARAGLKAKIESETQQARELARISEEAMLLKRRITQMEDEAGGMKRLWRQTSTVEELESDKRTLLQEVSILTNKLATAEDTAAEAGSRAEVTDELGRELEKQKQNVAAADAVNHRLVMELERAGEIIKRLEDRNDELTSSADQNRRLASTSFFGSNTNLADELGSDVFSSRNSLPSRRQSLSSLVSPALSRSPDSDRLREELSDAKSEITRLQKKLSDIGMAQELSEFQAIQAELLTIHSELKDEREKADRVRAENELLREMYKELSQSSTSAAQYSKLRSSFDLLKTNYEDAKQYGVEMEKKNSLMQQRIDHLELEGREMLNALERECNRTPSPRKQTPTRAGKMQSILSGVNQPDVSLSETLQDDADAAQGVLRWKIRILESDLAQAEQAKTRLQAELKAASEAAAGRDADAGSPSSENTQARVKRHDTVDNYGDLLAIAEAELRVERGAHKAYREEKDRIHKMAMGSAINRIRQLEHEAQLEQRENWKLIAQNRKLKDRAEKILQQQSSRGTPGRALNGDLRSAVLGRISSGQSEIRNNEASASPKIGSSSSLRERSTTIPSQGGQTPSRLPNTAGLVNSIVADRRLRQSELSELSDLCDKATIATRSNINNLRASKAMRLTPRREPSIKPQP